MITAEKNRFVLTWQQVSSEFPDGPRSHLLFRLSGTCAPKSHTICVIVDCSDSYDKAIQEINTLRKAISRWPSQWVVHFLKLSSPDILATQQIAEFCKGEDRVERYFESDSNQAPSQFRGSFLRPCIEAITSERSKKTAPSDWITFVLGDGQFTDFLPVTIPDWMRFVVTTSLLHNKDFTHFEQLQWGTKRLVHFISRYIPLVDNNVKLVVKGAPVGTRFFLLTDSDLQQWPNPGEWIVDPQQSVVTFLIDCEPEQAKELSWWIRSEGELVRLPTRFACDFADISRCCETISAGLRSVEKKQSFQVLFESQKGCDDHEAVQSFFQAGESAANKRNKWSLTDLSSRFDDLVRSSEEVQDAYLDAVLVAAARFDASTAPDLIIAIGLNKSLELQRNKGDRLGRFTVLNPFSMSFDRERRRWHLKVGDQLKQELGASSQLIELPLEYETLDVTVIFSKP